MSSKSNRTGQYGRKCFLCNNTRHKDKNCRLFRFPARGNPMRDRWLEALGLTNADVESLPNASARLCQIHFQPKDFLIRQLSSMAVPSVEQPNLADDGAAPETLFEATVEYILEDTTDQDSHNDAFEDLNEAEVEEHSSTADYEPASHLDSWSAQLEELINEKEPDSPKNVRCHEPQHRELEEQLEQARRLILQLQKENEDQKCLIEEQKSLLSSMGVQCVIIKDASYEELPE